MFTLRSIAQQDFGSHDAALSLSLSVSIVSPGKLTCQVMKARLQVHLVKGADLYVAAALHNRTPGHWVLDIKRCCFCQAPDWVCTSS